MAKNEINPPTELLQTGATADEGPTQRGLQKNLKNFVYLGAALLVIVAGVSVPMQEVADATAAKASRRSRCSRTTPTTTYET